jgi:predicted transcriptional regulator
MEGAHAGLPRVGALARPDVPRCGLGETMGVVRERVQAAGWDVCAVLNEQQIVLGLLRQRDLSADPTATAGQIMRAGPATYRPDALVADVVVRLRERKVGGVLSTRSDGTLIGWLRREDAEQASED